MEFLVEGKERISFKDDDLVDDKQKTKSFRFWLAKTQETPKEQRIKILLYIDTKK